MSGDKLLFRLEQPHGSGDIYVSWQKGSGNYLATTGVDSVVNIFDRHGQIHDRIRLQSFCTGFGWDSEGDLLAVVSQSPQITIWDANTQMKHNVDVGLRDGITCLMWAKTCPVLAVGTTKGNLSIYNHMTSKRVPIIGKHTKKILCGAWSKENLLAVGSEDKTISVSNMEGDTLRIIVLRAEPAELQFSEMKLDERIGTENTISVIVGKRTLYLYNMADPENPIELAFQQHYGPIVTYKWFGDGYILLGFGAGFFIAISTHIKEVGQELFQVRNHKNTLTDVSICNSIGKAASCGDNTVKIHDISNLQETSSIINLSQESGVQKIDWSVDGQLLAVCTQSGSLNVYVLHMPMLTAVCGPKIALLSSLTEVSLFTYTPEKNQLKPTTVPLEVEPEFIAVSQYHLAAGMNNRVWFYDLTRKQSNAEESPLMLRDVHYLGVVVDIKLNPEYASVLFDGKLQLHMIEQPEVAHEDRESVIFPSASSANYTITCQCLTTEFLVYGTDAGLLHYFDIEDWAQAVEYKHSVGINTLFADITGTRLVLLDEKGLAYVYSAVENDVLPIPNPPSKIEGVIWDSNITDRDTFIVFDSQDICTYVYVKLSIYGPSIQKIGVTSLVSKQLPLLMHAGEVMSATAGGQLSQLNLSTHDTFLMGINDRDKAVLDANLNKQLALHRYNSAYDTCLLIKSHENWKKFAEECLKHLEIELATRAYRHIGDIATVWFLREMLNVEDHKLLSGFVSMHLGDVDRAQTWFLKSSAPIAALEMRCDLLQWEQALQLAKRMAPKMVVFISKEYAQQLEFVGNYSEAFVHYEKSLQERGSEEHVFTCKSGLARTAIHCGNYKHGTNLALELNEERLLKECAEILEKKKQLSDAGLLFERAKCYDRAASAYITLKDWSKVGHLLPNVMSPKIYSQYAKVKEASGKYEDAVVAYMKAKDYDSAVRLHLDHLNNPEIAIELVHESKSPEGAKLVSRFFQRLNDYASAIKFLVMSQCHDEAFEMAKKYGKMKTYGEVLLDALDQDSMRKQDFVGLAVHFEEERNWLLAGKYWFHAKEYEKAMKQLLKAAKSNSDENEAVTIAIDVVASSHSDSLSQKLVNYLLGDEDGVPKDPKYLFRLYMARRQYKEAAKAATIIANEEQINGNYRNAHDVLFAMYQELRQNNIRIPMDMHNSLMLLHSYILVRLHVRRGDHIKGARLLMRVANCVSSFPSHIVPILTSTVIECHRAGLKHAAFKYAVMLMNPEHRKSVDPKYAKKIEAVVRKPPKNGKESSEQTGDPIEAMTPCPFCEKLLPETQLTCSSCASVIPFCVVTGRHLVKNDLTACPECDFPALRSEFMDILETENSCPMCSERVEARSLLKIEDSARYLSLEED